TTNSAYAGADAIKISGNSSSNNVNITADGNISLIAVNEGKEIGSTVSVDHANMIAKNGDFNLNISGVKGSPFNNATITANNISMNGNISANDAVVLVNTILTAKNDIKANLNAPNNKSFTVKGNSRVSAGQNISLVAITAAPSVEAITILGTSSNNVNITAGNDISITASSSSNVSGAGIGIAEANIETKSGNFTVNNNGSRGIALANVNLTANEINVESNSTGSAGWAIRDSNITATTGNITANGTSKKEGGMIKSNTTLNAKKDINLVGVTTGGDIGDGEGLLIQGNSESSRNNLIAQGNITLNGKTDSGIATLASVYLINTNLTSTDNNININGSSKGARNIYFTDVALNARAGNITVYSETQAALPTTLSSALSLGGNISIKAQNSSVAGKALNTILGSGVGFRANSSLSVEGNATFQGETEGTGATRRGIDFSGANTLNIAKDSKLFFLGENKGAQVTAGGNGITYTSPKKLTINNNGSLIMEGRSTSGTGINFPTSNDTIVLNGEGDTLIKGSSVTGGGVAISGVVNNSTGPVTIEGASTDGTGVHLFSGEHQINRINVTGISTQAEGLRISGNANITDTVLIGRSINSSGIKVDSLPGSSVTTHAVLDNASLNGSSTNGNGVEVTSDIKGIHQSFVNGTTDGIGYGIDIGENLNVTGTSEADLLILQGVATTGTGTGIKLNGNNDLSNTSLNSSAVDGIALDITGPLANQGNVILNGTASGSGTGAQVNGSLSDSVVNGTSANGIGVQINGSLENSRINGISANGSGVKVDGETTLDNATLNGNSSEGKGVDLAANLSGNQGSAVQGDTVNGTGIDVGKDVTLSGGGADDPLTVSGNARGEKGTGVQLDGNNTLDNTTLSGNATDGHGVEINGPLINNGNTTINGKTSDDGHGVHINGAVSGGEINGHSDNSHGVFLDESALLNDIVIGGGTVSYKPPVFIALPETIGEHVTLNGKPIDKTQPEGSKAREGDNLTRGKYTPLPPVTDPVLPPASTDDEKNTKQTSTLTPSQKREDPDMLIMARNHILSTLEGRDLSSSVVNESEQSAAGVTGIMVCFPLSEASEHEPCDTYILDKGQPHLPMMVKK
ncbi:beta strand repeat-containing protein, partial [Yersinia wautersii]|uniref:beta strand repeat-containing protein n=1 Tax=Yersinia wautersii TaxID=1341643 RepID=UPI00053AE4FA